MSLFPFSEYWWFYLGFIVFVIAMLALDLGLFHRTARETTFREATIWTAAWISLALVFNVLFYQFVLWRLSGNPTLLGDSGLTPEAQAWASSLEFLTGFVVEKTLAVDNIFVFAMVFSYFSIPKIYQHRILLWGILGALVFRALFVAAGSYLMSYHWVVIGFGVLLIFTGIKLMIPSHESADLNKNFVVRLLRKILPITPDVQGGKFFVVKNGVRYATPLFLALAVIEMSDIIFAIDSVPAIFAITNEPLIVFTSNIFAILGLRSMYFMLAGAIGRFVYIKYGLAAVLIFVGAKMAYINQMFGGKFPITWSLGIIVLLVGGSVVVSLVASKKA